MGNTVAAAVANTRVLEPVEANIALIAGAILAGIAALAFTYPRVIAYPIGVIASWFAAAILYRGIELYRNRRSANATRARDRDHEKTSVSTVERNPRTPNK